MFTETRAYTVPLTKEIVDEFVKIPEWAGERNFRPRLLHHLRLEYEQGRFHSPEWATALCQEKKYRINGQHTSSLLKEVEVADSGAVDKLGISIHFTEFACPTVNDLFLLFTTFDSRPSVRSGPDYAGTIMSAHSFLGNVLPQDGYRLATGMATYFAKGKGLRSKKPIDRCHHINDDPRFILDAHLYVKPPFYSPGFGAALYATWRAVGNTEEWKKFWEDVLNETDPEADAPSRTLARRLRAQKQKEQLDARGVYVIGVNAWNAHRANKTRKLTYGPKSVIPTPL